MLAKHAFHYDMKRFNLRLKDLFSARKEPPSCQQSDAQSYVRWFYSVRGRHAGSSPCTMGEAGIDGGRAQSTHISPLLFRATVLFDKRGSSQCKQSGPGSLITARSAALYGARSTRRKCSIRSSHVFAFQGSIWPKLDKYQPFDM